MSLEHKDILDMASLSVDDIQQILDTADSMKEISERPIKKVPTLRGKTVILFFYEPSTRTRLSFDIAAKRLSADSLSISASTSSLVKGETLLDTAKNLEAMHPDVVILRHAYAGAPHMLASRLKAAVINAGDGTHAHPTQALLDMLTIRQCKGTLAGLKVAIIGDIAHSRVARSNSVGLTKMGSKVTLAGPPTMMPKGIESLGVEVAASVEAAIEGADVVMMLRIQKERQKKFLMSTEREYARFFGLNARRADLAKPDAVIMHPGPMNRGVEIAPDVADGPRSVILDQVTNGVAVRMALLYLVAGGGRNADTD
ncbi:MAG: aspartate carbamoyltransferase catalytic subunit [Desulfobacteraceae bacterium]|jgi:aspartate carbamoyltransferase catalytic subunit